MAITINNATFCEKPMGTSLLSVVSNFAVYYTKRANSWWLGYKDTNKIWHQSLITDKKRCQIFIVKNMSGTRRATLRKSSKCTFGTNELLSLNNSIRSPRYSVSFSKNTTSEPLYQALSRWMQEKMDSTVYPNLMKAQWADGIEIMIIGYNQNNEICVCSCSNASVLHRSQQQVPLYKVLPTGGSMTTQVNLTESNNHKDGFFIQSGYYSKGKAVINKKRFILFSKNYPYNLKHKPDTKNNIINDIKGLDTNAYVAAKLIKDNDINYKTININSLQDEEDSSDSRSPSDYINDLDQQEVSVNPSSGRSSKSLSYLSNLNNYTLYFVPCKDSRSDVPNAKNSFFKNSVTLKLQNDAATAPKQFKDGPKYYLGDNNNTIYAVVPRENFLPSTAEIQPNATKTYSTFSASEIEIEELAKTLDNYFHINRTDAAAGPFGNSNNKWRLPGKIWNSSTKKYSDIHYDSKEDYYFAQKRMPRLCCLIVKKDIATASEETSILDSWELRSHSISFNSYFKLSLEERMEYEFLYDSITLNKDYYNSNQTTILTNDEKGFEHIGFSSFLETISPFLKICLGKDYSVSLSLEQERGAINLYDLCLIEAYTRGHDIIQDDFATVRPKEKDPSRPMIETSRLMEFDDNYFTYKYTGRDIDIYSGRKDSQMAHLNDGIVCSLIHEKDLLLESDVTLGDTYGYQKYFIQAIKYPELTRDYEKLGIKLDKDKTDKWLETGRYLYKDTFKVKNFLKAIDDTKYVEEDYKVITSTIDLLSCKYYDATQANIENKWCDCSYGGKFDKECIYQKCGICPYRFTTEKHPRRIRTLEQSKSNRFNLIQEISKVFEVYPQFYIEFDNTGHSLLDSNGRMKKHVFFMTEKGQDKYAGFRYEKNLNSISRSVDSNSLTTKMYVESVDSDLTESGICSIQTAEDNIGKNAYVMNFSYFTKKNLLNPEQTQRDIYGIEKGDLAFLPTIGAYNTQYDKYTNLIINLTNKEMTTLQASNEVAITGITTALEERKKISQRMYQFKMAAENRLTSFYEREITTPTSKTTITRKEYTTSDTYISYLNKYREQAVILWGLVEQLFFSDNYFTYCYYDNNGVLISKVLNLSEYKNKEITETDTDEIQMIKIYSDNYCKGELFWKLLIEGFEEHEEYVPPFTSWLDFKEKIVDTLLYTINGELGQYKSLNNQVKFWKMEREKILNKINDISDKFYKIYEPYIKEGTWTDSNYLTDNEYYWAAEQVLSDSCKPKLSYSINVIDISPLEEYEDDYSFEIGDTTFIEDIDFFDINQRTGLPNREKVLLSEITYSLDTPQENSIVVQNYTSAFDDLFESITASVQSLTYNENTYKRASNFTAKQYIQTDSLQGTLNQGDLTLLNANDSNIVLDDSGTSGSGISNSASQYKMTGEGLFFSTDGGETWDLGVGPQGFNMDYAKFGQLDASKVQIVDGQYIYFLWDKNGINAYRNPATSTSGLVDFARFNKYGLSLVENGHVRLRAGYEYKSTLIGDNPTGNYQSELPLTNQNVGFYLYNDSGKPIFKTETQSEYGNTTEDYSARLSLKGEMFVTNRNLSSESNNGTVMDAVIGKQLSGGYYLSNVTAYEYAQSGYNALFKKNDKQNYIQIDSNTIESSTEIVPEYNAESDKSVIKVRVVYLESFSKKSRESSYFKPLNEKALEWNNNYELLYPNLSSVLYTLTTSGKITSSQTLLANDLANNSSSTISLNGRNWGISRTPVVTINQTFKNGNNYYDVTKTTVKLKGLYNNMATATISEQNLKPDSIDFYESPSAATPKVTVTTKTLYPYSIQIDNENYTYWENYDDSTEVVPTVKNDTATEQVGIFINNKKGISDEGEGSTLLSRADVEASEQKETETSTSLDLFSLEEGQFYFCGDSITEGFHLSAPQNKEKFIGVGSMGISNYGSGKYVYSSTDLKKIRNASYLAFNFGLNDCATYSTKTEDELIKKYADVISNIVSIKTNKKLKQIYIVSTVGVNSWSGAAAAKTFNSMLSNCASKIISTVDSKLTGGFIDIYNVTDNNSSDVHGDYETRYNNMTGRMAGYDNKFEITISDGSTSSTPDEEIIKTLAGAQRLFSIVLQGNKDGGTVFNNVISVLKNGCLYIGGEVRDYYGRQLSISDMSLIPDEIRIDTPTIIMSNSGTLWCDWSKFKYINPNTGNLVDYSLMDAFNGITDGINDNRTTSTTGWYIEDPIKD